MYIAKRHWREEKGMHDLGIGSMMLEEHYKTFMPYLLDVGESGTRPLRRHRRLSAASAVTEIKSRNGQRELCQHVMGVIEVIELHKKEH